MTNTLNFTGWKKWCPTAEEYEAFEVEGKLPFELLENEYLIIYEDMALEKPQAQYCYENGKFRRVSYGSIVVPKSKMPQLEEPTKDEIKATKNDSKSIRKSAKKVKKNDTIFPRNIEQVCAIDLLKDRTKPVKLLLGTFGSGKTYLAINTALEALYKGEFEKIIWIRNNVRVADTPDLGILPGNVNDKLILWGLPIADVAGESAMKAMLNNGTLSIEPLQTLRGRNFSNSILICDEAENLSLSHIKLILGRAGEGSEVWFLGDLSQKDLKVFEKSKGIENMIECLKGNKLFTYTFLVKSERSEIARLADTLDKIIE